MTTGNPDKSILVKDENKNILAKNPAVGGNPASAIKQITKAVV